MTAGTEHDREPDSDLVSIIMPTYNCGAFIAETIATVQAQTHPRWELIVVDDCSTDDTTDVVGALAKDDPRIRYVRLETNSGAAMARNRAMELPALHGLPGLRRPVAPRQAQAPDRLHDLA